MTYTRLRALLSMSFIALCCVATAMGSVSALEYGGIGGRPANPDPANDRTKSIFVYTLAPGASKTDAIQIVNSSDSTAAVDVYAVDAATTNIGSFSCKQAVEPRTEVGQWIHLETASLQLPARTNKVVNFDVEVPSGAAVGEHDGCIVVQRASAAPSKSSGQVNLNFRSATRVAITVPGKVKKSLQFAGLSATQQGNIFSTTAALRNEGNVSIDTTLHVETVGWFNKKLLSDGGTYPVLQHQTRSLTFSAPKSLWGGWYTVRAVATYNPDPAAGIGAKSSTPNRTLTMTHTVFVSPKALGSVIYALILLALIVGIVLLLRRRTDKKLVQQAWIEYRVRDGDSLQSLAAKTNTPWKRIARANNLKPPYFLKTNDNILLPPQSIDKAPK